MTVYVIIEIPSLKYWGICLTREIAIKTLENTYSRTEGLLQVGTDFVGCDIHGNATTYRIIPQIVYDRPDHL
jgi:hypothetical protein